MPSASVTQATSACLCTTAVRLLAGLPTHDLGSRQAHHCRHWHAGCWHGLLRILGRHVLHISGCRVMGRLFAQLSSSLTLAVFMRGATASAPARHSSRTPGPSAGLDWDILPNFWHLNLFSESYTGDVWNPGTFQDFLEVQPGKLICGHLGASHTYTTTGNEHKSLSWSHPSGSDHGAYVSSYTFLTAASNASLLVLRVPDTEHQYLYLGCNVV